MILPVQRHRCLADPDPASEGIPTALLSLPLRNMHSPNETADLRDIRRTGRLLAPVHRLARR
ncbi:MAG: hypothetical protein IPK52_22290 [Chloroflexi bacterium]|nr:hypothetical protein [Chloroflexota bacterium]